MSAIAKPMAHSTTSTNGYNLIPVEMVTDMTDLSVPAIANYGPKFVLSFTLSNGTNKQITYATAALLATAKAAYRTAYSANF